MYANGSNDTIFLRITTKKGSDVIDSFQEYYQSSSNYNVWEIEIPDYILSSISKHRSGKVQIGFTFSELVTSVEGINYLGTFGTSSSTTQGDIPSTGEFSEGDYYICNTYNFYSDLLDDTFTYQQSVYFSDSDVWITGTSFIQKLNTALAIIPVDLALNGLPPQNIDESFTEQIIDRLAYLESAFTGSLTDIDYINFNKDWAGIPQDGMLYYDNSVYKQTLTFVNTYENGETQEVNIGQKLYTIGKNNNEYLPEGTPVACPGVQGDYLTYLPAKALYSTPELNTMIGVLTTNVNTNEYGPVVSFGQIDIADFRFIMEDTDDSMLDFGTKLYLSVNQAGRYTTELPTRPNAAIWIATVLQFNSSSHKGVIFVNPIRLRMEGDISIITSFDEPVGQVENDFWYDLND
jgi:hypothetical protein